MERSNTKNAFALILLLFFICINHVSAEARFVVRSSPGGTVDTVLREVKKHTDVNFLIDNRPGAGGEIALKNVIESKDNSIYVGQNNIFLKYHLDKMASKNTINIKQELDYFAHIGNILNVIITHPSVPARDIKSLISLAKSNKSKINVATTGVGSTSHVVLKFLGGDFYEIPYKSSSMAHFDLIAGNIDVSSSTIMLSLNNFKNKRIKIIGKLFEQSYPGIEEVKFLPGFKIDTNIIMLVRKGYSNAKLQNEINNVLNSEKFINYMFANGIIVNNMKKVEFLNMIQQQERFWLKIKLIDNI